MLVRQCAWDRRCPLGPEVLGPPGVGATDSCELQDRVSEYLELRSSAKAVCSLSMDHLFSPTPFSERQRVFMRFPMSLRIRHLTSLYSMINTFSSKSFFHSKLAMLSCLSILKITLPLFLWLLQRPPKGPWSPENWPRTIESILAKNYWKRHSSGIENTRSPGRQHMGKITSELSWPATDACVLHVWKWHHKQRDRAQDCPPRYLRQKVLVQDNA